MQPKFMILAAAGAVAIFVLVIVAHRFFIDLPDREARPPAIAEVRLEPLAFPAEKLEPLELVGAWQLHSDEPRVGGISGLGIDGEQLVAITDAGVVLRFPKQLGRAMRVRVSELPAGPGSPRFKRHRDSEALARDAQSGGWWVAFEYKNELWRYDRDFTRAVERRPIPRTRFGDNKGVEGLAATGGALLLFPEGGGEAIRLGAGGFERLPLASNGRVSDAVALGGGRLLMIERRLTLLGFRNALVLIEPAGGKLRTVWRKPLPVGPFDNFEAVASERRGDGHRLWLIADNNYHPPMRTVLMLIDVPMRVLQQP